MANPWISFLIAVTTGGLMGAIINVVYQRWSTQSAARAKQQAVIEALSAEINRSRALCDYNAGVMTDITGPFVKFPTTTTMLVSFTEREKFPRLSSIQGELVHYSLALLHINQLIELHHVLWMSPEMPTGSTPGASGRRDILRARIGDICWGKTRIEGVGPNNFVVLPNYINHIIAELNKA
jgi:hypothetical protein